jgi:hypothetical protein
MTKAAILILPAALLCACSAGKEPARESTGQDPLSHYESDFRPSDHDTLPPAPAPAGRPQTGPESDNGGVPPPVGGEGDLVSGFRVQIFSTTDIDAAKAKKEEAESDFPSEWFYIQYDPPTYKIRGGNFIQRYEAERFIRLAVEKGFTGSWAVPEKVYRQPPPRTPAPQ